VKDFNTKNESEVTLKSIQATYNAIAAEFDVTRYKPWPQTVEFINELPDNSLILDLGCGNGRNTIFISAQERGFRIIGLDFSKRLLNIASEKTTNQGLVKDIDYVLGDIVKLPFSNSSIDAIIFVATLHHLPSAELRLASLLEVERCLKPGGKGFIGVWDFEQERFADELEKQLQTPLVHGEFGDVWVPWTGKRALGQQRFYHLFYQDELKELLEKTELQVKMVFKAADNYHAVVEKRK
jgi:ubiquinone/menaquinone biosynthesis C-methylase UbiE